MDDLISRQSALDEENIVHLEMFGRDFPVVPVATLNGLPTVDAIPVVRCKDCVRFRPDDDVWGWCTVSVKMRLKDYCSYGVRKDGEQP